jgi:hypothetical protein
MAPETAQRRTAPESSKAPSPPLGYVTQFEGWWRVAVPIRGTTQLFGPKFLNQATANAWVQSGYGQRAVARTLAAS